jgi:hypothetical protein
VAQFDGERVWCSAVGAPATNEFPHGNRYNRRIMAVFERSLVERTIVERTDLATRLETMLGG